jgi:hypothetical protein
MILKTVSVTVLLLFHIISAFSQNDLPKKESRFTSTHTSFPDSARAHGHTYDSVWYSPKEHYSDSSVLVIVPKTFHRSGKLELIFWFHGWNNNIDTAVQFYEIERQFLQSKRNAVLVLAETAKNAPDSYGGKLEQQGVFKELVNDVVTNLKQQNIISHKVQPGNIVLAGHSGAYRVIAYILANGKMPVSEVYLFDALYSQTDKFLSWIQQDKNHHFVNWYTDHGGTYEVSIQMMKQLDELHVPYTLAEEPGLNNSIIKSNRILFVHSPRAHNVIINHPDNLKLLLENQMQLSYMQ